MCLVGTQHQLEDLRVIDHGDAELGKMESGKDDGNRIAILCWFNWLIEVSVDLVCIDGKSIVELFEVVLISFASCLVFFGYGSLAGPAEPRTKIGHGRALLLSVLGAPMFLQQLGLIGVKHFVDSLLEHEPALKSQEVVKCSLASLVMHTCHLVNAVQLFLGHLLALVSNDEDVSGDEREQSHFEDFLRLSVLLLILSHNELLPFLSLVGVDGLLESFRVRHEVEDRLQLGLAERNVECVDADVDLETGFSRVLPEIVMGRQLH